MRILAIIPDRGGSKGISSKNIRLLADKPLIGHTITEVKKCASVNRVVVSTDDVEITDIALHYGAEVIRRPDEFSTDTSSSESALLYTLDYLRKNENYESDLLVFLQCTSPLTKAEDIEGAIKTLLEENADTAFSAAPSHRFIWKRDVDGCAITVNHDKNRRPLRQDMELEFVETGAIYVMRTSGFRKAGFRFFGKTVIYQTPSEYFIDIDNTLGFHLAETLFRYVEKKEKQGMLPKEIEAVIFDFDGVFTNNRVLIMEDGKEAVLCSRGDGMGISMLKKKGFQLLVLSTETNSIVKTRCDKLDIECIHGSEDKKGILIQWLKEKNIDKENIIYVGNDINDIECLQIAGCGIAVKDAYSPVKEVAQIVLSSPGGRDAVRELADLIL